MAGLVLFLPIFRRPFLRFSRAALGLFLMPHILFPNLIRILLRGGLPSIRGRLSDGRRGQRRTEKKQENASGGFLHRLSRKQSIAGSYQRRQGTTSVLRRAGGFELQDGTTRMLRVAARTMARPLEREEGGV